jgi:hypothetical protein
LPINHERCGAGGTLVYSQNILIQISYLTWGYLSD